MTTTTTAHEAIKANLEGNDVVLFMKGTAQMPQCGFSSRVAGVLNYMGIAYKDVNVLADPELRETPILMLTAKGRETDVARGVGAGADAYVTKPFSTRELVQRVRDMLA